jgi:hypothetical protein
MFQGEPTIMNADPEAATHFWNYVTESMQDYHSVVGHHDIEYNPINNTFLTLKAYTRQVGNNKILYDLIQKMSADGTVLWTWDTYDHIPLSQADSINSTTRFYGELVIDLTHANALDWDYNHGVIYLNLRHTDTFYKINETNGDLIWSCGKFGNFTLLDAQGRNVSSLWYHSHDTTQISPGVFTMFDNDYDNMTNPNNCHSRMLEITVDETSMIARETFSWEAPKSYWSPVWGSVSVLPNGNFIGCFGPTSHQSPQNRPWDFNNTGAILAEVNRQGQLVRTWTFPVGWGIYRAKPMIHTLTEMPEYSSTIVFLAGTLLIAMMVAVVKIQFSRREMKTNRHLPPR